MYVGAVSGRVWKKRGEMGDLLETDVWGEAGGYWGSRNGNGSYWDVGLIWEMNKGAIQICLLGISRSHREIYLESVQKITG